MDEKIKKTSAFLPKLRILFAVLGLVLCFAQLASNLYVELQNSAHKTIISAQPDVQRPVLEQTISEEDMEKWKQYQRGQSSGQSSAQSFVQDNGQSSGQE